MEAFVLHESGMSSGTDSPSATTIPSLRRLLDETSDLIDSPPFTHVLTRVLDAAFSLLIDTKISHQAYKIPPISASAARVQELVNPEEAKAKVANILAVFSRQAHSIGAGSSSGLNNENEYLAAIDHVKDLEAFAAVVYSSHFEAEALGENTDPGTPANRGSMAEPSAPDSSSKGITMSRPSTADTLNEGGYGGQGNDVKKEEAVLASGDAMFEQAWGRALAKEDGKIS
jgi:peroxin-3